MTKISKLRQWDAADHLDTEEAIVLYLDAAFAEGEPAVITAALGDIARAKGMTEIARKTGLARESLYRSLCAEGNPEFATVLKVIDSLGLKLHVTF